MRQTATEIQELLIDYARALRDGCIPVLLKSITRGQAQKVTCSLSFWAASEVVRVLNDMAFGEKVVTARVSLYMSRVDAKIRLRLKKVSASRERHRTAI